MDSIGFVASATLLPAPSSLPKGAKSPAIPKASRTMATLLAPLTSAWDALTSASSGIATAPTPSTALTPAPTSFSSFPSAPSLATSGKVLVWFRADLRLHDHAALHAALETNPTALLPVFTFDPRHFGETDLGFQKTGRQRAQFILDSVAALRGALRARGSDLIIRFGEEPEAIIPQIASSTGCSAVYFHREATYEDQTIESKLEEALRPMNVELHPHWGGSLYHIDDLPFAVEDMPDVYTDFREEVEKAVKVRDPLPVPERVPPLPRIEPGKLPTMAELGMNTKSGVGVVSSVRNGEKLKGGEEEALRRLEKYVAQTAGAGGRSASASAFLGAEFSCQISPWLAMGCISARRIYAELVNVEAGRMHGSPACKTTTYFELVWRDFFKFVTWKYAAQRLERTSGEGSGKSKACKRSGVNYIAASQ